MSRRGRDNVRIAFKVLGTFTVLLIGLLIVRTVALSLRPEVMPADIFTHRPSSVELAANTTYAIFLFLTFLVPLLVLRYELRKRKRK